MVQIFRNKTQVNKYSVVNAQAAAASANRSTGGHNEDSGKSASKITTQRRVGAGLLESVTQAANSRKAQHDIVSLGTLIPQSEYPAVLARLEMVSLFAAAKAEEREELVKRVRCLIVEREFYLLREGTWSTYPAIFMIQSGAATVSIMMQVEGGGRMEVDVKEISAPDYFGEGTVLTGAPAYASVRACGQLVVHVIPKSDIDEVISTSTRDRMLRDNQVRQFRKEHVKDMWDVIVKDAETDDSGMQALRDFCRARHTAILEFYDEVILYKKKTELEEQVKHAQEIWETYLDPRDPLHKHKLVPTSQQQRRVVHMFIRSKSSQAGKPDFMRSSSQNSSAASTPRQSRPGSGASEHEKADELISMGSMDESTVKLDSDDTCSIIGMGDGDAGIVTQDEAIEEWNAEIIRSQNSVQTSANNSRTSSAAGSRSNSVRHSGGTSKDVKAGSHRMRVSSANRAQEDAHHADQAAAGEVLVSASNENKQVPGEAIFDDIVSVSVITTLVQDVVPKFMESNFFNRYMEQKFPLPKAQEVPRPVPSVRVRTTFIHKSSKITPAADNDTSENRSEARVSLRRMSLKGASYVRSSFKVFDTTGGPGQKLADLPHSAPTSPGSPSHGTMRNSSPDGITAFTNGITALWNPNNSVPNVASSPQPMGNGVANAANGVVDASNVSNGSANGSFIADPPRLHSVRVPNDGTLDANNALEGNANGTLDGLGARPRLSVVGVTPPVNSNNKSGSLTLPPIKGQTARTQPLLTIQGSVASAAEELETSIRHLLKQRGPSSNLTDPDGQSTKRFAADIDEDAARNRMASDQTRPLYSNTVKTIEAPRSIGCCIS